MAVFLGHAVVPSWAEMGLSTGLIFPEINAAKAPVGPLGEIFVDQVRCGGISGDSVFQALLHPRVTGVPRRFDFHDGRDIAFRWGRSRRASGDFGDGEIDGASFDAIGLFNPLKPSSIEMGFGRGLAIKQIKAAKVSLVKGEILTLKAWNLGIDGNRAGEFGVQPLIGNPCWAGNGDIDGDLAFGFFCKRLLGGHAKQAA